MLPCRSCRWKRGELKNAPPPGPPSEFSDYVLCRYQWDMPCKRVVVYVRPTNGLSDCRGYEDNKVYQGRKCSEPPHEVAVVEPWSGSSDRLVIHRSDNGLDWGNMGPVAQNAADAILWDACDKNQPYRPVCNAFLDQVVAKLPDAFELTQREVLEWVDEWKKRVEEPHRKGVTERKDITEKICRDWAEMRARLSTAPGIHIDLSPKKEAQGAPVLRTAKEMADHLRMVAKTGPYMPSGEQLAEAEGLNEPSFSDPEVPRDWWRSNPLPITSKTAFILGVTAGAITRAQMFGSEKDYLNSQEVPIRACHVKASVFDGDDKDALCRKAQEFLAWYYGTGPSEMPEWLEWEGEDASL